MWMSVTKEGVWGGRRPKTCCDEETSLSQFEKSELEQLNRKAAHSTLSLQGCFAGRMQNGPATLQDTLALSYNAQHLPYDLQSHS